MWKEYLQCREKQSCIECPKAQTMECWPTEELGKLLNEMGREILRRGGPAVFKELPREWEWNPEWLNGISGRYWDELPTIAIVTMFGEICEVLKSRQKN